MKPQGTLPAQHILARMDKLRRSRTRSDGAEITVGLVRGTTVQGVNHILNVEEITAGTPLLTRTQGSCAVVKTTRRRALLHAVRITAAALGRTSEHDDLILPLTQQVLLRDWRAKAMFGMPQAVVPAYELIDGEEIIDLGLQELDLYCLHFDRPHVIYAAGIEVSTGSSMAQNLRPAA